jgi:hypothetical protein
MSSTKIRFAAVLIALGSLACFGDVIVDPDFDPTVASPAYPDAQSRRAVIAIDETHANGHTHGGLFGGFSELLAEDGAIVQAFATPYDAEDCAPESTNPCAFLEALTGIDVLVIANARQTISAGEALVIKVWVLFGGSLLVIADHNPNPPYIAELGSALGVEWKNADGIAFSYFTAADGTLDDDHPITVGRSSGEEVPNVVTFRSSVLSAPSPLPNQRSILTFPPGVTYRDASGTYSAAGMSAGMAFTLGFGRVFASAEGAMWTAQRAEAGWIFADTLEDQRCGGHAMTLDECIEQVCPTLADACVQTFCPLGWTQAACFQQLDELAAFEANPSGPPTPLRAGMQVTHHNQQFVLNVVHWLDKLL